MYFIEGLADDRDCGIGKIHHALADGVASANLLARGMDLRSGGEGEMSFRTHGAAPTTSQLLRTAGATT